MKEIDRLTNEIAAAKHAINEKQRELGELVRALSERRKADFEAYVAPLTADELRWLSDVVRKAENERSGHTRP